MTDILLYFHYRCSLTGRNRLYPVTEEIKKPGPGHHLTPAKQDPGLPTSTSRQDPGSSPTPVKPVTNISQQNDTPLVDPAKAPVPSVVSKKVSDRIKMQDISCKTHPSTTVC